jgi:cupin 2 domain-containing protein
VRTYTAGKLAEFEPSGEERFETLAQSNSVRVERIVSRGHCSAPDFWYDQSEDEFVLVISGAARLQFEDGG